MFSSKTFISFKDMDILDDMGVSKLLTKVFFKSELLLYVNQDTFTGEGEWFSVRSRLVFCEIDQNEVSL